MTILWALKHNRTHLFRHRHSAERKYTSDLSVARVYQSLNAAMSEATDSEHPVELDTILGVLTLKDVTENFR